MTRDLGGLSREEAQRARASRHAGRGQACECGRLCYGNGGYYSHARRCPAYRAVHGVYLTDAKRETLRGNDWSPEEIKLARRIAAAAGADEVRSQDLRLATLQLKAAAGGQKTAATLLRDDPAWTYESHGQTVQRRLRVYRTATRRGTTLWMVLTERGDGVSITNASWAILAQLRREYPDDPDRVVVEHYPQTGDRYEYQREHFDQVWWEGIMRWRRIPVDTIVAELGPGVLDGADAGYPVPGNS